MKPQVLTFDTEIWYDRKHKTCGVYIHTQSSAVTLNQRFLGDGGAHNEFVKLPKKPDEIRKLARALLDVAEEIESRYGF